MKNKINVIINILTVLLLLTENSHGAEKRLSIFHKDKFLLFKPVEGTVEVYENMMIPYMTPIRNVFLPAPTGTISRIKWLKNGRLKITTVDGIMWYYERFKLRLKRNADGSKIW